MSLYNEVEYAGYPFAQTHPDRLATIAALCGLEFAPIATCRVLEIGCGDGGNLIPLAVALPDAQFTGFDLAERPIAAGNKAILALELKNVSLRVADVMTVDAAWGQFDYIVTHGLYSWTPPAIRDRILKISKQNLSPNGVAFVSYNALPGSRLRQMLREMMLFQVSELEEPAERIAQAKALLGFVAGARVHPEPFNDFVDEELARMQDREPWALFHDELADVYEPVYFNQFMEHAGQHGLQYLAEADFPLTQETGLTADAIATLDAIADDDRVLREQYVDFAICRRFRQTLLCHQDRPIHFPPTPDRLANLYVSSAALQTAKDAFEAPNGMRLKSKDKPTLAALQSLIANAPQVVPVHQLKLNPEILLSAAMSGVVELHTEPRPLVIRPGAKPLTSPLLRYQLAQGLPLTTLHHATLNVEDEADCQLLALLDGTRNPAEIKQIPDATDRIARLAKFGVFAA
ncbi:MAG: Methyltransferase type 12 [Bryobacterales bacterium]|nr:Methyltransferase type 12 [Bryobacterales bacterium]